MWFDLAEWLRTIPVQHELRHLLESVAVVRETLKEPYDIETVIWPYARDAAID